VRPERAPAPADAASSPYTLGPCMTLPRGQGINEALRTQWVSDLVGADAAVSTRVADNRVLWFFGDTLRVKGEGFEYVRNSALMVSDERCHQVVDTGRSGALVPDRPDGVGYWPMAAVARRYAGGAQVLLATQRVRGTANGASFENLGLSLVLFDVPDGAAPQPVAQRDIGPDAPSRTRTTWGAAMLAAPRGRVFLYGTYNPDEPLVFGYGVRLARAPLDGRIVDRRTWRYWTGSRWSRRERDAAAVIDPVGGVDQTFSVFQRQGRTYALSKQDGFVGNALALWPADEPTGPFESPVLVGDLSNRERDEVVLYMPLAHPELPPRQPGTVVVTVSRNSTDLDVLRRQPLLYRPFLVEVPVPPVPSDRSLEQAAGGPPPLPGSIPASS